MTACTSLSRGWGWLTPATRPTKASPLRRQGTTTACLNRYMWEPDAATACTSNLSCFFLNSFHLTDVLFFAGAQKLQIQSMESREERLSSSSAQSTPSSTPHSSPKQQRRYTHTHTYLHTSTDTGSMSSLWSLCRSWFNSTGSDMSISSSSSSVDIGDTAGGTVERWSVFGPRPLVHKSTSDLGSEQSATGKQRWYLNVMICTWIAHRCFRSCKQPW